MDESHIHVGPEERAATHILLVDDDPSLVEVCSGLLRDEGYEVTTCTGGPEALELLRRRTFEIALLDLNLPRVSGLQLMEAALKANPSIIPIIITGEESIEASVEAIALGAFTYLPKPFSAAHLKLFVGQATHFARANAAEPPAAEPDPAEMERPAPSNILGEAPALLQTMHLAERTARTDASVFIYGESGTGKDLIAHFIHARSRRKKKAILAVNCAALPEALLESEMFGHRKGAFTGAVKEHQGLLEAAHGGTLFLDEITEMSPAIQAKLLRVIQDGRVRRVGSDQVDAVVDVRFIAATNQNPDEAVAEGKLREDLYYRLRVIPIVVPPLRERAQDIPLLAEHFLEVYWAKHQPGSSPIPRLGSAAIEELQGRQWSGNVRELQNVIEHLVVLAEPGQEIEPNDLPAFEGPETSPTGMEQLSMSHGGYHEVRQNVTDDFERRYLEWVVEAARGNMSRAARIAGVDRTTLYRLMEKHDLAVHREVRQEGAKSSSSSAHP